MAIEIPPYLSSKVFDLNYMQQLTPAGTFGYIQTLNRSSPAWMAEYSTPPLRGDRLNEMTTFFDLLEGSTYTFLAYDPRRTMPYAYRHLPLSADPWTQVGQAAPRITAQDYANSTISLDRMENGVWVTKGDYISVLVGSIWYLFRSNETVQATGNAVVGLSVKPRPQILSLASTDIRYRKAVCEMKMVGKQEETDSVEDVGTAFRWRGGQFNNRTIPI